jgi:flagellar hook assembly protein FlgD
MDFSTIVNNVSGQQTPTTQNSQANETDEAETPSQAQSAIAEQSEQFDTFLNLLTAQIQNQDPLAPLDSTQFVEQLATFSNLELQATTNQILEGIANLLASQIGDGATPPPASTDA